MFTSVMRSVPGLSSVIADEAVAGHLRRGDSASALDILDVHRGVSSNTRNVTQISDETAALAIGFFNSPEAHQQGQLRSLARVLHGDPLDETADVARSGSIRMPPAGPEARLRVLRALLAHGLDSADEAGRLATLEEVVSLSRRPLGNDEPRNRETALAYVRNRQALEALALAHSGEEVRAVSLLNRPGVAQQVWESFHPEVPDPSSPWLRNDPRTTALVRTAGRTVGQIDPELEVHAPVRLPKRTAPGEVGASASGAAPSGQGKELFRQADRLRSGDAAVADAQAEGLTEGLAAGDINPAAVDKKPGDGLGDIG
jgi:hypothetical protein